MTTAQNPESNQAASSDWIDELLGRTVGTYRLETRLGGGAMASVYQATDERNGQAVAVKLLLPGADLSMRERFRREVLTVSRLDHPNIVHTYEVSQSSGELPFIAMELVIGESLGELLERAGQLSPVDGCALLAPIARALDYAHQQGFVHRDVKPSNILLRRSTWGSPNAVRIAAIDTPVVPLLSDFGIARVLDAPELTSAGRTIGTPTYMAPEQCAGSRDVDGRADIYALGAVLYRCLMGRPVFLGTTTQILHAHVYEPVTIPDDNLRLLSPIVVEILQLSLSKLPEERYPEAVILADDLAVAAGQKVRSTVRRAGSTHDATATMVSIPSATAPKTTSTHVLVDAPVRKPERKASAARSELLSEDDPVIPRVAAQGRPSALRSSGKTRAKVSPRRWFALAITSLVALIAMLLVRAVLPSADQPVRTPTVEAVALATASPLNTTTLTQSPTKSTPPTEATPLPATSIAGNNPNEENETISVGAQEQVAALTVSATVAESTATPLPTETATPSPSPTSTTMPTPVGDPAEFLTQGLAAFVAKDWQLVVESLSTVWRIDSAFKSDQVLPALTESYLNLAAANNVRRAYTATVDLLTQAQTLLANHPAAVNAQRKLNALATATHVVVIADTERERVQALVALQNAHMALASELEGKGRPCDGLIHLDAARAANNDFNIQIASDTMNNACDRQQKAQAEQDYWSSLSGSLLYSSNAGSNTVNIYRQPVTTTLPASLLIENARFPVQQSSGPAIAYYSTSDIGLYSYDRNKLDDPALRGRALATKFTEDGRDFPSSWNFDGSQLIFASEREDDRRLKLFVVNGDGQSEANELLEVRGTWPAWRPVVADNGIDWIVFNGADATGNNPGLWLVSSDGSQTQPLTQNGDDIAPVWTPTGDSVVFMSLARSGNWDIYRVALSDSSLQRITWSAANDILPAVSPDGKTVAFMSDRGGTYQIWVVPIDGDEARLVASIEGTIPEPAQHSMQWVD